MMAFPHGLTCSGRSYMETLDPYVTVGQPRSTLPVLQPQLQSSNPVAEVVKYLILGGETLLVI